MSIDPDHLNYVVKVAYNGTNAAGGDSLTEDLNIFYEVSFNHHARLASRLENRSKLTTTF